MISKLPRHNPKEVCYGAAACNNKEIPLGQTMSYCTSDCTDLLYTNFL